jgi:hypothetical protein
MYQGQRTDYDEYFVPINIEIRRLRKKIEELEWNGVDATFFIKHMDVVKKARDEGVKYVYKF